MFFEQLHQKVMHVAALVQRNLLALQVGHRLDGGTLGHQHRFGCGAWHGGPHVGQRGTGGLGKNRGRFTHVAEVDGTDVQGLQLHGPGRELGPLDGHTQGGQAFFQGATALEQTQQAFLVADTQLTRSALGQRGERCQ